MADCKAITAFLQDDRRMLVSRHGDGITEGGVQMAVKRVGWS